MDSNRKKLENAGLIDPDDTLTQEQSDALESLTPEETDALISIREKLSGTFQSKYNLGGEKMATLLPLS